MSTKKKGRGTTHTPKSDLTTHGVATAKDSTKSALNILKKRAFDAMCKQHPQVPGYAIPQPKYSDKTANGLTKCVIDWLKLNGWQAERINSTGRMVDNRTTVTDGLGRLKTIGSVEWIKPTTTKGTADISATIYGRSVKIEVKCEATGDRYQSDYQKNYQRQVEQAGGVYIIARTFAGFYAWLEEFKSKQP